MERKNQGFTLVELIVSIGILAVVGLGIGTVAYQGVRQYRIANAEINVQQEAQLTGNQLKNLVMNANDGVGIWEGNLNIYSYDADEDIRRKSIIRYDATEQKLFLIRYVETAPEERETAPGEQETASGESETIWTSVEDETGECLAEYVSAFSVTLLDAEGRTVTTPADRGNTKARSVRMKISYELDGKSYELEQTVTLRNGVLAGSLGAKMDEDGGAME